MTRSAAQRIAIGSILVAAVGFGLKLCAWWLTGSVALMSDALETVVNVVGAVAVFGAVRYAARPADDGHPFGHHKAENLSAVIEGLFIVIAAGVIFWQALVALRAAEPAAVYDPLGLSVSIAALGLNLFWALHLLRQGRRLGSPALEANGTHLMSDVWTTFGVLGGIGLVLLTGWTALDPILAMLVAVHILREGAGVIRKSVGGLMDEAATPSEQAAILAIIRTTGGGALQAHDLRTRRAGATLFAEFHLVVARDMTVGAAHDICDRIEAAIERDFPNVNVTIHVEPDSKLKTGGVALSSD